MTTAPPPGSDRLAKVVGELPDGVSADARWMVGAWTTIRFANGRIHQPHFDRSLVVSFRVADDGRLGIATTDDGSLEGLRRVAASARALARHAPREKKFRGFPSASGGAGRAVAVSESTARSSPEAATRLAERILAAAGAAAPGARIAGVVNVGGEQLRVVNSTGLDRWTRSSAAQASVLVDRPDRDPPVSGWSEGGHWDAARLEPERLGREAAERMARTAPGSVAPGAYRVVLRPSAVEEMLGFLSLLGFGGHGEEEGWSCLRRSRGKRIAPEFVDLVDDPRSPSGVPRGIDYEGTLTHRTPLIEDGVAGPAVTDLVTAGRLGARLTGHATPPEAPYGDWGPYPAHLILAPGDASEEELVRATKRGILVTRFHYVRVVDPGRGVITGMTRDGTYRIDGGEIVEPVRNLRFTESILTALKGIEALGRERRTNTGERGGASVTVPAALVRSFRFTSATLF